MFHNSLLVSPSCTDLGNHAAERTSDIMHFIVARQIFLILSCGYFPTSVTVSYIFSDEERDGHRH